jgi:uncharacterized membrane protein
MNARQWVLCVSIVTGFFVFGHQGSGPMVGIPMSADAASHEPIAFDRVQPIFEQRCVKCHAGQDAAEGLRLTSYQEVMAGTEEEKVVVPGQPDESELVKRITGASEPRMPLDQEPLSDDEIDLIVQWIEAGAEQ